MDEYLDDAWQSGEPPFHGATVRNEGPLTLPQLRAVLTTIVDSLERRYGRGAKLLFLEDWHEHDGFRHDGARIEWAALRAMLADERRLLNTQHGDFNVYRAVYPVSAEWLLRWYIGGDEEPVECEFTFSASDDATREIAELARQTAPVTVERSAEYFRKHYAG
jgi:hypothetical protein